MPRRSLGEKLEKVVSTKISHADFMVLEKYARIRYNENRLRQPTVSRLLRVIIKTWTKRRREEEEKAASHTQTNSIQKTPQKYEQSGNFSY
jgi:uncharacterized protein (UPF0305 family)